jgi:ABC-2 type transport system permease protein
VIALLRTEWSKVLRRPRTYVALGLVVAVPALIAFVLWSNPPGRSDGPRFFFAATQSGLLYPAAALNFASRFLLIVVVALFAGDTIAGEASTGNLRYLLVRPIGRGRLLAAKLTIAVSLALVATFLVALTATIAGGAAFGFSPIEHLFFFQDQSVGNLFIHIGMSVGYITWSLASIVAFGFMVSTMTNSAGAAAGAAVGLGVVSQILDDIESLGHVRDFLPFAHYDAWTGLFWSDRIPSDFWSGLLLPIPYVLGFCAIAWWWFKRKDVLA